jgi:hypothetical protein
VFVNDCGILTNELKTARPRWDLFRVLTRFVHPGAHPLPVDVPAALATSGGPTIPKIDELPGVNKVFTQQRKAYCAVELEDPSFNLQVSIRERDEAQFRSTLLKAKPLFNALNEEALEAALTALRITIHTSADEAERGRLVREIKEVCAAAAGVAGEAQTGEVVWLRKSIP